VLVNKAGFRPSDATAVVLRWSDQYFPVETSPGVLLSAIELSSAHGLRIWDAIILSAAASTDCRLLLSEDLQEGFTWSGVTVVTPFGKKPNELLLAAFDE
jgi:predicted nucleic acid-binding protein